ncbi:hypothetical protein ES332_A01G194700v1 [Gossypium tomentosum]|uniref:Uncharacterized protein n=1 Tax=Gossypium tomentosum TaxID=34277 RepID=A0A5D2RUX6_GOSTO|nr:hypothetical protein ES332_A01G194700v1 [Gossypium tomentosum]
MVEEMALLLSPLFWKLCPLSRGTLVLRQLSIKCQRIQRRSLQVQYPLLILLKSRKQVLHRQAIKESYNAQRFHLAIMI